MHPPDNEELAHAIELHKAGNFLEAQAAYGAFLASHPQSVEALNLLASLNAQQGKSQEALGWLAIAADFAPDHAETYYNRGLITQKINQPDKAFTNYDRAVKLRPDYTEAWVNRGVVLNKLKRYDEALASYDKAISLNAEQAISHYNRGLSLQALERYEDALASFDKALLLRPAHAMAFSNKGSVLHHLKDYGQALACFDGALALNPNHAASHYNLGLTLQALERYDDAIASYDNAITYEPESSDSYSNRAICLSKLTRFEDALESCKKAIALSPDNAKFYYNHGNILKDLKRFEEALASYDKSIQLNPDIADVYSNRGVALNRMNKHDEALESYDKAIKMKSTSSELLKFASAEAYNNRSLTLKEMGRFEEALVSSDKALELVPDYAEAHSNRGVLLQEMRRYEEAMEAFDKAIAVDGYENAIWNKAVLKLLLGDWEEGWRLYEWRWRTVTKIDYIAREQYLWLGKEHIAGQVILVHAEQGLGDTIQLARYIPLLVVLGARVILRIQAPLKGLMSTIAGLEYITTHEDPIAGSDVHCPFFSLPLAFGTRADTVPQNIPYLFVDAEKKKQWQARLGQKTRPRIGLVWAGAKAHVNDAKRSIPLRLFAHLLKGDYEFHSLQKEYREFDEAFLTESKIISHSADLGDFTDTAALVSEMDLVISVDTSVAHLVGALGMPLFLLLTYTPDYRWMMHRDDTPWYPSARLFRQKTFGDWEGVLAEVAVKLNIPHENKPAPDLLVKAIGFHRANNFKEAQAIYEQLLLLNPEDVQVLSLYGIMHAQMGQFEQGLGLVNKAVGINPEHAEANANRAVILQSLNRSEEALQSYNRAIASDPAYADAYANRGIILSDMQRYPEALASYDKAITLSSNDPIIHYNRANVLRELGQYDEAIASYDCAIELKPDYAEAHNNKGLVALKVMDRYSDALASFEKAIALNANYEEAYDNRGLALRALNKYEEAVTSHNEAIALKPDNAGAYDNRGAALQELNRHAEALESFSKAIALKPDYAEAHNSKGFILQKMLRYEEALASFDKAIAMKPDYADAYWNKAVLKLLLGDFKEGWELYEWRWKSANRKGFREFEQPLWLGKESLKGKTLLVHAEQGLGDTIQLCRYMQQMKALGAKILFEVPASLITLIVTLEGSFQLVVQGSPLPAFDYHCPLFSLPLALGTTLNTILANIPYLYANAAKQQIWQHRLGLKTKPRIGIVWSGDTKHQNDRNRSIPFHILLPILQDRFEFHALQKEVRSGDSAMLEQTPIILHINDLKDFSDTAALISELDLVISIDTSVAHLAGAMGKEVWILLPIAPDYRWLTSRPDSPWYPTARLFRQDTIGNWAGVLDNVKKQLGEKKF